MRRIFILGSALSFLVCLPLLLLAQVADSLPGPIPPSGPIVTGTTALIGVAAALATGIVGKLAAGLDNKLGTVDSSIRKGIGPVLPIVTTGLSILLPVIGKAIGITDLPTADIVASAPTAAIIGVASREALRKWILPLLSKRSQP